MLACLIAVFALSHFQGIEPLLLLILIYLLLPGQLTPQQAPEQLMVHEKSTLFLNYRTASVTAGSGRFSCEPRTEGEFERRGTSGAGRRVNQGGRPGGRLPVPPGLTPKKQKGVLPPPLPTPTILALDSRTRTTANGFSFNWVFGSKGFGTGLETSTFVMPLRWKSPF